MNDRYRFALRGIAAAATFAVASHASAVIVSFTTRAAFDAAVGGGQLTENFSGFAVDTEFRTVPVPANGFVIQREGVDATNFRNLIDVPPLGFPDNNGTTNASSYTNAAEGGSPGAQVRMTFPIPARAFGADFYNTTIGEGLVLEAFNGTTLLASFPIPLVANGAAFFGVHGNAGESITSVRLRSNIVTPGSGGEGYGMDDVAVALIPEPATGSLVAAGAALLLARRGRRA